MHANDAVSEEEIDFPFAEEPNEVLPQRKSCVQCRRPLTVCWCPFVTSIPDILKSKVTVLQHPYEDKRCLSTTQMLTAALPSPMFRIIQGNRFNLDRNIVLKALVELPNTVLLYPGTHSTSLSELNRELDYHVLVLDGTWMQARGVYQKNTFLHSLPKVKIVGAPISKYVVRTQPNDSCLSTVECVAWALQALEDQPGLYEKLTAPLDALCRFQLENGAVHHQSKQYLIDHGLYKSQKDRRKPAD